MLKGTKSTNLSYQSIIDNTIVVVMSVTCPEGGVTVRNISIRDKSLYEANKEECRADIESFEKLVYELEDSENTTTE